MKQFQGRNFFYGNKIVIKARREMEIKTNLFIHDNVRISNDMDMNFVHFDTLLSQLMETKEICPYLGMHSFIYLLHLTKIAIETATDNFFFAILC